MKNNAKWGLSKYESGILTGNIGIIKGRARDTVTKMFWIRRMDVKYKRPIVNLDFNSL